MSEAIANTVMGYGMTMVVLICITWLAVTFGPIWYGFRAAKKHSDHVAKLWGQGDTIAQTALKVTPIRGRQN